jgi:hypothetical protein
MESDIPAMSIDDAASGQGGLPGIPKATESAKDFKFQGSSFK